MRLYFSSTVDRILAEKSAHAETLQRQIDYLLKELDRERSRANKAIDELIMRSGSGPVSIDTPKRPAGLQIDSIINKLAGIGGDFNPESDDERKQ